MSVLFALCMLALGGSMQAAAASGSFNATASFGPGDDLFVGGRIGRSLLAGIDTKGSTKPYGGCRSVTPSAKSGHWCKKGVLPGKPSRSNLKYGRQTIYGGPSANWKAWCGMNLRPRSDMAMCALSTKYIKGLSPNSPYCGKVICIRFVNADKSSNPYPPASAKKYFGKTLKCQVCDLCPECDDDHVDILGATPYIPTTMPQSAAFGVGIWSIEWNFVPPKTDCKKFFASKSG